MAEKKTSAPRGSNPSFQSASTPVMIKFSWEFPATLKIKMGFMLAGIRVIKAAIEKANAAGIVRPGWDVFTISLQRPQQRNS